MSRASAVMTVILAYLTDPEFSRREAAEPQLIPSSGDRRIAATAELTHAPAMTPAGRAARTREIPDAQAK